MTESPGQPSFLTRWVQGLDRHAFAWGLLVFVLALAIRLAGIGWGLPSPTNMGGYHPDEPVNIAYSQNMDPLKGDFTPDFYNYGTFYLTLTHFAAKAGVAYGGAPAEGTPPDQAAIKVSALMTLGGRILSALCGAGVAVLAFLILFKRTHIVGPFVAAAALAMAPGLVVHSRFATVDVPAVFFGCLSLYWAVRMTALPGEEGPSGKELVRFAIWSGIMAGLSAACKYSGVLFLLAPLWIIATQFIGRTEKSQKAALINAGAGSLVACLAAFFLGVPAILLEPAQVMRDVIYEFQHTATGHGIVFEATSSGFIYHLGNLNEAFGLILVIGGLAGLGRGVYRGHSWLAGMLIVTLVTYILIGRAEVKFLRYVFPLLPALAVGLGWAVGQAHTHPKQQMKIIGFLAFVGLGGVFGGGLTRTVQETAWMSGIDPRDQAAAWLKENVKSEETIGLVSDPWFYTPPVFPQATTHILAGWERKSEWMALSDPKVVRYVPEDSAERYDWDARLITEIFPDYIVVSSFERNDVARVAAANVKAEIPALLGSRFIEFTDLMAENYDAQPAMIFGGNTPTVHDMMYIRPTIWIWKKKEGLKTPVMPGSKSSSSTETPAPTP